ncbi:MAG: hypothetical protein CMB80_08195 [Flammeovirgaceae bacterium]|nr:hypothetical protein [Flammeovirgaceae bacterium]
MKLKLNELRQIIKEEISNVLMEDEAVVPPPEVQDAIRKALQHDAGGRCGQGQVHVRPIIENGKIVQYDVITSPQSWPGALACVLQAVAQVADEIASIGVQTGVGPNVVDCTEDSTNLELGRSLAGKCKVVIGNPAGKLHGAPY